MAVYDGLFQCSTNAIVHGGFFAAVGFPAAHLGSILLSIHVITGGQHFYSP